MRCRLLAVFAGVVAVGVCGGRMREAPADEPEAYTGKVVAVGSGKSKHLELQGEGKSYSIIEDGTSKMLFLDKRLRDRPMQLTGILKDGNKLRVVRVQSLKNGVLHDVDYWCEICQISLNYPGLCVCCNEPTVFRERPAR